MPYSDAGNANDERRAPDRNRSNMVLIYLICRIHSEQTTFKPKADDNSQSFTNAILYRPHTMAFILRVLTDWEQESNRSL